jgi:hypothetical protein
MHTKRLKELTGNSPNKTDRKDSPGHCGCHLTGSRFDLGGS